MNFSDLQLIHQHTPWLLPLAALVLGLLLGSFLNVVIYRLPLMMERAWRQEASEILEQPASAELPEGRFNLVVPHSRCPHCGTAIKPWQNIPVLSYLLLRGRCGHCGHGIAGRYPLVELVTGLLSLAVVWQLGATPQAAALLALTWALVALTGIDFDHKLLPDQITLPLLWGGLLLNLWGVLAPLQDAVVGAIAGYLALWSVYWLFKLATGKEGMGYGDFKLLAALGAWLGWQALPGIILLSSVVGAVVGIAMIIALGRDRQIPILGPYLATAGWIYALWGERLNALYLGTL